jgi:FAD/FMN-containing dehydrogenase
MLTLDTSSLRQPFASDRHYVRVASGSTLRFVNNQLDALKLALENMGGWDAQTIAGVIMTATHGSGLAFGPIASQVASMQLVTANGVMLQIEPDDGITDPRRFPGHLPEEPSVKLHLVQSSLVFNAVLVSMGCMGILYAVVLRTVDRFWLRETREVVSWIDLAKPGGYLEGLIRRPRDPGYPDHVEVSICPSWPCKTDATRR